ncbi:lipopolysaccharide biosynthesis protein [Streptomyces boninensis]|uniref:tyrosine-protein kinase domain-containing protein n=1 Tax=Streptomyces boninensis TaxID=2039455 RepID=UPI003B20D323
MTQEFRTPPAQDEPDLLRDQFRQLLRHRGILALGVLLGLLGGGWMGLGGGESYVATSEVTIRQVSLDPFAPSGGGGSSGIKENVGTERQTAVSNSVAHLVEEDLGGDAGRRVQSGLQVTNPPNTMVLRFSYAAAEPEIAAKRSNAFAKAYLTYKRQQIERTIDRNVKNYDRQIKPLKTEREDLDRRIAGMGEGRALESALSARASLSQSIGEITSDRAKVQAIDTTPGYVVRTAEAPQEPSGPGLFMLLGLGAAVGLGVGLVAAWVRLVFDPTARSEGDVVRALRAPVLGKLPRGRRHGPLLAMGRTAEEYRSVAFRLAYGARFADRRRLLVVAPRGSSDTAAAVSVNLAASFVEMGHEVMLVEADLRTPSLHERLRTAEGVRPGWARTPEQGETGWPTGAQIPIDAGESGAFDLVPGARVRNPARALTSASATRLISEADAPGSVVVALAPAVLSYADAIALADRVDGVLVVCDPREVHREDLVRVRELISGAGGAVLGAVLHSFGDGAEEKGRKGRRRKQSDLPPEPGGGTVGADPGPPGPPEARSTRSPDGSPAASGFGPLPDEPGYGRASGNGVRSTSR